MEKEEASLFDKKFRIACIEIINDFFLAVLIIGLLALTHKISVLFGLSPSVMEQIEQLDTCSRLALLALLSASLLIRFLRRTMEQMR